MTAQTASLSTIMKRARNEIDDESDIPSRHTAQVYLDALRRMMIVDEVPAWDASVRSSKRLITTAKRHLGDPSLTAALLQMSPERMLADLETAGFLFESLVAHELRTEIDKAADSLHRLADRVMRKPTALVVVTGTSLAYTRDDGVHVVPLGILGP